MFAAIAAPLTLSACGAKVQDAVTETGNPSLIDKTRITTTPLDGILEIEGSKDAVPADAEVVITNERTDEEESTRANDDGSFSLEIDGKAGDKLTVQVKHDGQSETLRLTVASDTDETGTTGTDTTNSDATDSDTTTSDTEPEVISEPDDTATNDSDTSGTDTTDDTSSATAVPVSHRATPTTCDDERGPGDVGTDDREIMGQCAADEDCQEGANGRCYNNREYAYCTYDACTSDNDCTSGPCECESSLGGANECMDGNCRVDADCGEGGYCSPTQSTCGAYSGVVGYWCHTAEDECVNDDECVSDEQGIGYCMYSSEVAHWLCSFSQCVG